MTQKSYTPDEYWYRPLPAGNPAEGPDEVSNGIGKTTTTDKPGPVLSDDGLPWQAFAVVGDRADPGTWHLPHHTKLVKKAVKGKIGYEHTVDWKAMPQVVYQLSRYGRQQAKLPLDPEQVLQAATHLAMHYIKAGKPLPTIKGQVPDMLHLPSGCHFRDRCPRAVKACGDNRPELREVGKGRRVACIRA